MSDNIVIVESPAKAKTIEKFLGKDFEVLSSYGHIRDLSKKDFGIDLQNNYTPHYIVSEDKEAVVNTLKKAIKKAKEVWLASDEDREGEAIAWHLCEVLELDPKKTKRIVFHEITKTAIQKAIENPRTVNIDLVNAQQARRVLDRIVGFELSPVLWKKVQPSLSAGRVQSVAVRLLVDREREIINFKSESFFKIAAVFNTSNKNQFVAEYDEKPSKKEDVEKILNSFIQANFSIADVVKKPSKRSPSAPFTTSTLQQEASRKLGFSVSQTMTVAQRLYEAGHITYMRTDSVNLSETAIEGAKTNILKNYGDKYYQLRQFTTKAKGAQEAHEAIRPTYIEKTEVSASSNEMRLYELIWKRTIASQMKDAEFEKTTATINISNSKNKFVAHGQVLVFDGFLKVYQESHDEDAESDENKLLPVLKVHDSLEYNEINAIERFTHHPARYTEASLVKKMEELGIGRPSTYAPTISTIQNRGYVVKEDRPGTERKYYTLNLKEKSIQINQKSENTGAEKNKLFPKDIGMLVNDFLTDSFNDIMDFQFTANVEKEFDDIAIGKMDWRIMIDKFYKPFHLKVEETLLKKERNKGKRVLGADPSTGKEVSVLIGRFGPMVQLGEATEEEKPKFASLRSHQYIETISLAEALDLFQLPRKIGKYNDVELVVGIGRFGPYVKNGSEFVSINAKTDDPYTISLERAIEIIELKKEANLKKIIKTFKENESLKVLNGRWGPYLALGKENYKLPKGIKADELDFKACMEIIDKAKPSEEKKVTKTTRKKK